MVFMVLWLSWFSWYDCPELVRSIGHHNGRIRMWLPQCPVEVPLVGLRIIGVAVHEGCLDAGVQSLAQGQFCSLEDVLSLRNWLASGHRVILEDYALTWPPNA